MTAAPLNRPDSLPSRLLTVTEYAACGETESGYTELLEGRLIMNPSPMPRHNYASGRLLIAIDAALPPDLVVIQDVDLDLRLAEDDKPGFSRRPDLMVVRNSAMSRVDGVGGMLTAADALLTVEIVSPGSERTDRVVKRGEYADAGIPHYWIVELGEPVSVLACHQAGEFGYADGGEFTGRFATTEPFGFELDLSRLG
ncbi:MAG TPA: Uma2 family endonuclease [Pseudonocardia sp.]|uniref:Uma2 family endonuclease n=1 Tax=Pseudonocardia sp. TaxID=60912 RepID=UPI002F42F05F